MLLFHKLIWKISLDLFWDLGAIGRERRKERERELLHLSVEAFCLSISWSCRFLKERGATREKGECSVVMYVVQVKNTVGRWQGQEWFSPHAICIGCTCTIFYCLLLLRVVVQRDSLRTIFHRSQHVPRKGLPHFFSGARS